MHITRLKAPTVEEIAMTIRSLEQQFQISSGKFQADGYALVPEDIAAEWTYALEQRRVLTASAQRYWKTTSGARTQSREVEPDRCDIAASVAA